MITMAGLAAVLLASVRLPLLVLQPGPAPDVAKRTRIDARTFPSEGSIHLTTAEVNDPQGATGLELVAAAFDGNRVVFPREAIYPSGRSDKQTETVQVAQMVRSEMEAAVAALHELGRPYQPEGVFVTELAGPSAGRGLVAGDIITAVGSKPVPLMDDLARELRRRPAGESVQLRVLRGGRARSVAVKVREGAQPEARLGAELAQYRRPPVEVSISSRDIGGPSAGLMYALSIYDQLVPDDLTGGRTIAGTGTIGNGARNGEVGAVGSVKLKVKGADRIDADVFLVPKPEVEEAREFAGTGMRVIGVSTLAEAISELRKLPPAQVAQEKT